MRLAIIAIFLSLGASAATTAWRHSRVVRAEIDASSIPSDVPQDIAAVVHRHGGLSAQMGYGGRDPDTEESYTLSYYRPVLVAKGFPYTLDPVSVETTNVVNIPISQAGIASLRQCATQFWLIPRGRPPFLLRSRYNHSNLFTGFREEFLKTHELRDHSKYFDLWFCRGS